MKCNYYDQNRCVSCRWITTAYPLQLKEKQQIIQHNLAPFLPVQILDPVASEERGFRNKAKMAVLGTVEKPLLGIICNNEITDLCECPLYDAEMQIILDYTKCIIKKLQLAPYNLHKKKGELKFIIVTQANGQFMLRFVLRTDKNFYKIQQHVEEIQRDLPQIKVISVNIQPVHAAVLEGEVEYIITEQKQLPITLNNIPLFIQPKSFFQTNTAIAEKLYTTARAWLASLPIDTIWDLFCGVGGFGLHCVTNERTLIGIEINQESIACAKKSASIMGFDKLNFKSIDAAEFALGMYSQTPDVILVNPPRRGLGQQLTSYIQSSACRYILYSSCNMTTLVDDLTYLDDYQIINAQLFDMFPHTAHMEILVLLKNVKSER